MSLNIVRAQFLKDLRQLWLLAALTALIILTQGIIDPEHSNSAGSFLSAPAALFPGILLIRLIQQDSAAGLRYEWLTRPIGGLNLFAAKFLLAVLVIPLPDIVGTVIGSAQDGVPLSESLPFAIAGTQNYWIFGLGFLLVAVVTETFVQAAGVLALTFFLFILLVRLIGQIPGDSVNQAYLLGSSWVVSAAIGLIMAGGGIAMMLLLYAKRRRTAARYALGATIGLLGVVIALPESAVLTVQQGVAGRHPVADGFALAVTPSCPEVIDPDQIARPASGVQLSIGFVGAGKGGLLSYSVVTRPRGLPEGWRMMIADMHGSFTDRRGAVVGRLYQPEAVTHWRVAPDGTQEALHRWQMPRKWFEDISRRASGLNLDYRAALLEPVHSVEIPADGRRHDLPGLGTCVAYPASASSVRARCFKTGLQPDVLTARMASGTGQEVVAYYPSFAPNLLEMSFGTYRNMVLKPVAAAGQPRVTITAYEARAYVTRRVSIAGLIGGRTAACRPNQPR